MKKILIHEGHEGTRRNATNGNPHREAGMIVDLLLKDEVFAIIGAAIEVHRELGPGFLEAVYQEALELELRDRNIPCEPQKDLRIHYEGRQLQKYYATDFLCYQQIIVELKALSRLSGHEESQVLNYLKATKLRVALLINFGASGRLDWKRFVN
jgi:GxxExxY protein